MMVMKNVLHFQSSQEIIPIYELKLILLHDGPSSVNADGRHPFLLSSTWWAETHEQKSVTENN